MAVAQPTADRQGLHGNPLTDPGSTLAGVRHCAVTLVGAAVGLTDRGGTLVGVRAAQKPTAGRIGEETQGLDLSRRAPPEGGCRAAA